MVSGLEGFVYNTNMVAYTVKGVALIPCKLTNLIQESDLIQQNTSNLNIFINILSFQKTTKDL